MTSPEIINDHIILYDTRDGSTMRLPVGMDWQYYVKSKGYVTTLDEVEILKPAPPEVVTDLGLVDDAWRNQPTVILGNGPSLHQLADHYDALDGKRLIVVNTAYRGLIGNQTNPPQPSSSALESMALSARQPDLWVTGDSRLVEAIEGGRYDRYTTAYWQAMTCPRVLAAATPCSSRNVIRLRRNTVWPTSISQGAYGIDSGMVALSIAINLGCNPIYLVGFDCAPGQAYRHIWREDPAVYDRYLREWQRQVSRLRDRVIVVGQGSRLADILPSISIDQLSGHTSTTSVLVDGMHGLGDNLYQRYYIDQLTRQYDQVTVRTPWPQLYSDLDVTCIPAKSRLRTQGINEREAAELYGDAPGDYTDTIKVRYTLDDGREGRTIAEAMGRSFGISHQEWGIDLPVTEAQRQAARKFLRQYTRKTKNAILVRPPSIRREWYNSSRNPDPEVWGKVIDQLRHQGFELISLAHVEPGVEDLIAPEIRYDHEIHDGVDLDVMIGLYAIMGGVVTAPGHGLAMALATKAPCLVVWGGSEPPSWTLDNPGLDTSRVVSLAPQPFCSCWQVRHACNKHIDHEQIIDGVAQYLAMR